VELRVIFFKNFHRGTQRSHREPQSRNANKLQMPFLELFDETLDINSTENYELSMQLSQDGFAFTLLDTIRNKYVLLRSSEPDENKYFTADQIGEIISKDDFLMKKYKKVNMVFPSPKSTLVPAPLFDPAKKEEYFSFNLIKDENEVILSNKITDPDAFIVFSVTKPFFDLRERLFPAVHPFHHMKPLLTQLAHYSKSSAGHYIHLHVEREYFNIIIYDRGTLTFSNTFKYRNISDILYYVLNLFKNKGINNDETIHFSGETEKFDDLWSNFALYIRNLKFTDPAGNFTFSYVFNDIGLHRFINLFSLTSCE